MGFDIDITLRRGPRLIQARIAAEQGLTALVGPSGAGKTSLLDAIAGLVRPESGRIAVAGQVLFDAGRGLCLPPERRACGYVFQDNRLFPHRRVRDNLLYGHRRAKGQGWLGLEDCADFLGIAHLLDRAPRSLSGGEARRVAIGRALLSAPRFLLMDEPLTALDAARREGLMALIERIRDELAVPILYVSHAGEEVARLAGQVVRLGDEA